MAYPVDYTRQFDYQSYQNANPTRPLPGDRVNADLNEIVRAVGETNDALRAITRSDGELANDSVGLDQISAAALAEIAVDGAGEIVADVEAARDAALDAQAAAEAAAASILQFGPAGNGSAAEDTAAFAAFMASSTVARAHLPKGTYLLDAAGIALASNKTLVGDGDGLTVIKCSVSPAAGDDPIYGTGVTNVTFEGITFDGDGRLTASGGHFPTLLPFIYIVSSSKIRVRNCGFIGFTTCGFLANVVNDVEVVGCRFERSVPASGPASGNHGIVISGSVAPLESYDITIHRNRLVNCQISTNCHDFIISKNRIKGWGFSAGINTQAIADSYNGVIVGNVIGPSNQAADGNGYFIAGIENWAYNTIIANNVVYGCYGSGIDVGGKSTVTGNVCLNNGAGTAAGGITLHYQDATFNASGTTLDGNICTDTRSGGSKTQAYGIMEVSASLTDIFIGSGNQLNGNLTGNYSLLGTSRATDMVGTVTLATGSGFTGGSHSSLNLINCSATTTFNPITNDGASLGNTTFQWSDAFLASGAVLNFNNGNYTVTHSAGLLTFSGDLAFAGSAYTAYTPTVTAAVGTFTSATGALRYKEIGKTVHIKGSLTITTVGTGSFPQFTLPINASGIAIGVAQNTTNGTMWTCGAPGGGGTMSVRRYDNTGAVASGDVFNVDLMYEKA